VAARRGRGLNTDPLTRENHMTTASIDLFVVDVVCDGERSLHGPTREDVAERFAAGVRAAGGGCEVLPLTLADPDFCIAATGVWPPRGFRLEEVASIYVEPQERFVASFIQGYDPATSDVDTPLAAAQAALHDTQLQDPRWFVYDRQGGHLHTFTQDQLDGDDRGDGDDRARRTRRDVLQQAADDVLAAIHADGNGTGDRLTALETAAARLAELTKGVIDATPRRHTPNGFDPRWVDAINDALEDRDSTLRAVDLDDGVWERFLGPLIDSYEHCEVPVDLLVDGFDEGAEGEHVARELGEIT